MTAAIRARHLSPRTERACIGWVRWYVRHHGIRHPAELGTAEVNAFLTALAVEEKVSASTQAQAWAALVLLYREVLERLVPPARTVVLLLYGGGLRLNEALQLRVKDLDDARQQLVVRRGKGSRDRITLFPAASHRAVREAVRAAGVNRRATCHTFRHSFATHLIEDGYDIGTVQELLGHRSVQTTMIYTHMLNRGGRGVRSPLGSL